MHSSEIGNEHFIQIKIPPKYKRPPGTFKNKQAEAKNFEEFAR